VSVINGQKADAATFNAAFASKQDDNTMFGVQTLSEAGSGATVSNVQQAINDVIASDALKIPLSQKGQPNGVAELGVDGKVPSAQLPSYVDDVVEVATFAALPVTGETGKIYVTLDTNYSYRWSGSTYVFIGRPIVNTDELAEGTTNLYFTDGRAQSAVVTQVITDGVTNKAPSEDAVFDALALKLNTADFSTSFDTAFGLKDTDDLSEGTTNLYFTDGRAQSATITQTITDGVLDKAPSSDAVYDALTPLISGLSGKQPSIQFKDEGVNLGSAGGVNSIDFVGPGIDATILGSTLTVTVNATGTGGGWQAYSSLALTGGGSIVIVPADGQQKWLVQASTSAGAQLSATPFGATPPTADGSMIRLIGNSDDNWVEVVNNDAANGCILNGGPARLLKYHVLDFVYDATLARYIEVNRNC
jgi:hypothetical protein